MHHGICPDIVPGEAQMILAFDRSFWDFEEIPYYDRHEAADIREKRVRNTNKYVYWAFDLLERTAPREKGVSETFTSLGLHMSKANNEYLHQHIGPWEYLDYSPVDADMPDDQLEIRQWFAPIP